MGSTKDKLARVAQTKEEIRQSLISKDVDVPEETPFKDYSKKIDEIYPDAVFARENVFSDTYYTGYNSRYNSYPRKVVRNNRGDYLGYDIIDESDEYIEYEFIFKFGTDYLWKGYSSDVYDITMAHAINDSFLVGAKRISTGETRRLMIFEYNSYDDFDFMDCRLLNRNGTDIGTIDNVQFIVPVTDEIIYVIYEPVAGDVRVAVRTKIIEEDIGHIYQESSLLRVPNPSWDVVSVIYSERLDLFFMSMRSEESNYYFYSEDFSSWSKLTQIDENEFGIFKEFGNKIYLTIKDFTNVIYASEDGYEWKEVLFSRDKANAPLSDLEVFAYVNGVYFGKAQGDVAPIIFYGKNGVDEWESIALSYMEKLYTHWSVIDGMVICLSPKSGNNRRNYSFDGFNWYDEIHTFYYDSSGNNITQKIVNEFNTGYRYPVTINIMCSNQTGFSGARITIKNSLPDDKIIYEEIVDNEKQITLNLPRDHYTIIYGKVENYLTPNRAFFDFQGRDEITLNANYIKNEAFIKVSFNGIYGETLPVGFTVYLHQNDAEINKFDVETETDLENGYLFGPLTPGSKYSIYVASDDIDKIMEKGYIMEVPTEYVTISAGEEHEYIISFEEIKTLEEYTWDEINDIANSGKAEAYFNLGDTKKLYLNNGVSLDVEIIGFKHDRAENKAAAITFWSKDVEDYTINYGDSDVYDGRGNYGGFKNSNVCKYLNGEFYEKLPVELQNVLIDTAKKTVWYSHYNEKMFDETYRVKLFAFSLSELGVNSIGGDEGSAYAGITSQKMSEKYIEGIEAHKGMAEWWTRTASISDNNATEGYYISMGGSAYKGIRESEYHHICFGFCIGKVLQNSSGGSSGGGGGSSN